MLHKLVLLVHTFLGYGLELTNPDSRSRGGAIRIFGPIITVTATVLFFSVRYGLHKRQKPLCEYMPTDLGPILINQTWLDDAVEEKKFPEVYWGGRYSPSHCAARDRVAIIVPYRDQRRMLQIFLKHMHQFLIKQQIEYGIFVVQQTGNYHFNRGKLLNIGFVESQKHRPGGWQCFIFHDIDLLPLDQRNLYSCPQLFQPKHLAAVIENEEKEEDYYIDYDTHTAVEPPIPPYDARFWGVAAMTPRQFIAVNGYSNAFWGWDDKDDDMSKRLQSKGYSISRNEKSIAIYTSLKPKIVPKHQKKRYCWYQAMIRVKGILQEDGLSTLKYALSGVYTRRLHTLILAKIGKPPSQEQLERLLKKYILWKQTCDYDQGYKQFKKLKKEINAVFR